MKVLALDPGPIETGCVVYDATNHKVAWKWNQVNADEFACRFLHGGPRDPSSHKPWIDPDHDVVAIEGIACMGQIIGRDTLETALWIGRYIQDFEADVDMRCVYRLEVKQWVCGNAIAKDKNIRQALIDRFEPTGGGKTPQIGTAANPGPLYGVSKHLWAALAVAITAAERWNYLSKFHDYKPKQKKSK